jgi:hypothetical protein
MSKLKRIRLLGGAILTAFVVLGAAEAAAKKEKQTAPRRDATKQPAGTLPEGRKLTAAQLARHIDQAIEQKTKSEKVNVSLRTTDHEFLRRVYLDLTSKIPTAQQAVDFLDSEDPDKRAKLIDELLASKDYGRRMADIWQALLLPRTSETRRLVQFYPKMTTWLEEQFNANTSWDKITREIVTAAGPVNQKGPVVYWLANPTADKATDNVTRMFLGVQLQCAQCHNHPFTDWKQNEYWHMAAFFMKVGPNARPRQAIRNPNTVQISETPEKANRRRQLPDSAKVLPPKFLGGEQPKVKANEPVRPVLAEWMTSPKNPFFARAMVNRVWGQLFGRGFINPVDDMHDGNANSHPELLADLSKQFAANGFDVKYLFRAICNSRTYQRGSKPSGNNLTASPDLFARMAIKPLTPEQTFDVLTQLMGNVNNQGARLRGMNGRFAQTPRSAFVAFFGIEDGADPTEYQAGIPQVLRLMNAPVFNRPALLVPIVRSDKNRQEKIEQLYLTVLSRRPTYEDRKLVAGYLQKNNDDLRTAWAGVLWALLNSSEFALNR